MALSIWRQRLGIQVFSWQDRLNSVFANTAEVEESDVVTVAVTEDATKKQK